MEPAVPRLCLQSVDQGSARLHPDSNPGMALLRASAPCEHVSSRSMLFIPSMHSRFMRTSTGAYFTKGRTNCLCSPNKLMSKDKLKIHGGGTKTDRLRLQYARAIVNQCFMAAMWHGPTRIMGGQWCIISKGMCVCMFHMGCLCSAEHAHPSSVDTLLVRSRTANWLLISCQCSLGGRHDAVLGTTPAGLCG
jgi:hypothetical protein